MQAAHPVANGSISPNGTAKAKAKAKARTQLPPAMLALVERDVNAAVGMAVNQVRLPTLVLQTLALFLRTVSFLVHKELTTSSCHFAGSVLLSCMHFQNSRSKQAGSPIQSEAHVW